MSNKFDYERAGALLTIVEQVSKVAPQMTAISSEAMAELRQMNQWLIEENAKKPKDSNVIPGQPTPDPVPSQPVDAEYTRKTPIEPPPVIERTL